MQIGQGATVAQARAALKQYKDVMQAAERIFDGHFDNVVDDDGDVRMAAEPVRVVRPTVCPSKRRAVYKAKCGNRLQDLKTMPLMLTKMKMGDWMMRMKVCW